MEKQKFDLSWQSEAACSEIDTNQFYPEQGKNASKEMIAVCEECPVKAECLNHALHYEKYGIWAGTSPISRDRLRSKLGIQLKNPNDWWIQ